MKHFFFDHTYSADRGHKFFKQLGEMGFSLEKRQVEHPGKVFCRFILLEGQNPQEFAYLEFIDKRSSDGKHW